MYDEDAASPVHSHRELVEGVSLEAGVGEREQDDLRFASALDRHRVRGDDRLPFLHELDEDCLLLEDGDSKADHVEIGTEEAARDAERLGFRPRHDEHSLGHVAGGGGVRGARHQVAHKRDTPIDRPYLRLVRDGDVADEVELVRCARRCGRLKGDAHDALVVSELLFGGRTRRISTTLEADERERDRERDRLAAELVYVSGEDHAGRGGA